MKKVRVKLLTVTTETNMWEHYMVLAIPDNAEVTEDIAWKVAVYGDGADLPDGFEVKSCSMAQIDGAIHEERMDSMSVEGEECLMQST